MADGDSVPALITIGVVTPCWRAALTKLLACACPANRTMPSGELCWAFATSEDRSPAVAGTATAFIGGSFRGASTTESIRATSVAAAGLCAYTKLTFLPCSRSVTAATAPSPDSPPIDGVKITGETKSAGTAAKLPTTGSPACWKTGSTTEPWSVIWPTEAMMLGLFAILVAQAAARFGSSLSTHSWTASGRPLIPPWALTYLIAASAPANPSLPVPGPVSSVRNARSIGDPWAVEPAVAPPLAAAALADPVDEFDEHAVSASAAAASPQTPPRRAPRFMGSPIVGRCQTTLVDSSLLVPTVAAEARK